MVKTPGLIIFGIILFLIFSGNAYCSLGRSCFQEIQDTLPSRPQTKHSMTLVSGYGNMLIPASVLSSSQSYYYGLLAYSFKNSLYFSAGSFHLDGYKPYIAFNSITAGYSHDINSWLDIDMSLSRYQIPERLESFLYKSFFYGNFSLGTDWYVAHTDLSVSSLFSQAYSTFYHIRNSRYIQTSEFSRYKVYISFEPYINIIIGTLSKISTSEGTFTRVKSPIRRWGNTSSESDSQSGQDSGAGAGPGPGNDPGGNSGPVPDGGPGNSVPGEGNTDPADGSGSGPGPGSGSGSGSINPGAGENGDNGDNGAGYVDRPDGFGSGNDAGQGASGTGSGKENGQTGLTPGSKSASVATALNQTTNGTSHSTIDKISDYIGLMEIEAGLPIGFNTKRFILEIEPGYVFPLYKDPEILRPGGFSFMVNFYFKLF